MEETLTKRWIKSAADEYAVSQGCWFDEGAAEHVAEFFRRYIRHSKGEWAGQPFELLDWQREDIIYPLFGWKRPNGTRRFRRTFVFLPKKNGKSTLASAIGLYLLVGDGEPGAEVYSAATDQQQANIVHGEAINMVDASPELSAVLKINLSNKSIIYNDTKSVYRSLSSEAAGKEGLNAHAVICDELHVWKGDKLWNALKYAFRARRQGLIFVITTAGDDDQSVCYQQYDYAKQVLSGEVKDDRFFGYIKEAAPDADWTDPEVWHDANPSLGDTIQVDDFEADVMEAKEAPASVQAAFKRYSLNIWSSSSNALLRPDDWNACEREFTYESLRGQPCYGGLDLSKTRDMTAFTLVFRDDFSSDPTYKVLPWFWMPEAAVYHKDSPSYLRNWADEGYLTVTPGEVCDYDFVIREIVNISQKYKLQQYAYDPWNAESTTQFLEEHHGIQRLMFQQNPSNFSEPTSEFERLVLGGRFHHNGNPILTWQARHVAVKTDANGNKRPIKPPSEDRRKIDGIVSSIMALAQAMTSMEQRRSVYEDRGVVSV